MKVDKNVEEECQQKCQLERQEVDIVNNFNQCKYFRTYNAYVHLISKLGFPKIIFSEKCTFSNVRYFKGPLDLWHNDRLEKILLGHFICRNPQLFRERNSKNI